MEVDDACVPIQLAARGNSSCGHQPVVPAAASTRNCKKKVLKMQAPNPHLLIAKFTASVALDGHLRIPDSRIDIAEVGATLFHTSDHALLCRADPNPRIEELLVRLIGTLWVPELALEVAFFCLVEVQDP